MWRFLFPLIAGLFFAGQAFGQTSSPAPSKPNRIGDTLSLYERDYFGLFMATQKFDYAVLGKQGNNGSITIHFQDPGLAPRTMIVDDGAMRELYDFTNNYEYYAKDAGPKFKPNRLAALELRLPPIRYENKGRQAEVIGKNGAVELGEIFYVTDSTIALWMLDLGYDWEFARQNVKEFRFADLTTIHVFRRVPARWIGGAAGLVVGVALAAANQPVPDLGNTYASTAVMIPAFTAVGFGLGYAVEGLFRFKKAYQISASAAGGRPLNGLQIEDLRKKAMFPTKVPPEFWVKP